MHAKSSRIALDLSGGFQNLFADPAASLTSVNPPFSQATGAHPKLGACLFMKLIDHASAVGARRGPGTPFS